MKFNFIENLRVILQLGRNRERKMQDGRLFIAARKFRIGETGKVTGDKVTIISEDLESAGKIIQKDNK